jgi:hypothetical protein
MPADALELAGAALLVIEMGLVLFALHIHGELFSIR